MQPIESSEFSRDDTGKIRIAIDVELLQLIEVAQLGWQASHEPVITEVNLNHATVSVYPETKPLVERSVAQPVIIVAPVASVCRIVERDQWSQVLGCVGREWCGC